MQPVASYGQRKKMQLYQFVETSNWYFKDLDMLADAYTFSQVGEIVQPADTAIVMHFFRQEEAWQKNNGGQ